MMIMMIMMIRKLEYKNFGCFLGVLSNDMGLFWSFGEWSFLERRCVLYSLYILN